MVSVVRNASNSATREDGNILILGLGYIVVVLVVVLVLVHIGGLYLERKRWQSVADGAALVLSDARVVADYLRGLQDRGAAVDMPSQSPEDRAKAFIIESVRAKGLGEIQWVRFSDTGTSAVVDMGAQGSSLSGWAFGSDLSATPLFEVQSHAVNNTSPD